MYTCYLAHHGIKGMQWGVRRYQNKDGSLTLAGKKRYAEYDPVVLAKKGETVNHVGDTPLKTFRKGKSIYVSKGKEDLDNYLLTMAMSSDNADGSIYNTKISVLNDLISPSEKARVMEFVDVYSDNKVVMAKDLAKAKKESSFIELRSEKALARKYQKANPEKVYKVFAKTLNANENGKTAYFEHLKKKGYNAWVDDNDVKYNSVGSKTAMAVFDTFKDLKISEAEKYTDEHVQELFAKALGGG
jgi:hypothetical protein